MDLSAFDDLTRMLATPGTRRRLLTLLGALPLAGALPSLFQEVAGARGHHQQPVHNARKHKKKGKKHRKPSVPPAASPPPPSCAPIACPADACGSRPDECGGEQDCGGCEGNQLCHDGICHRCDVTCVSGNASACGDDLQLALSAGGTIFVCPGRYRGNFTLNTAVTVIGAGQGAGVGTSTILDAHGTGRVVQIESGTGLVALQQLRITGGNVTDGAADINHTGTTLRMTACSVSGNTGVGSNTGGPGGGGPGSGGIVVSSGAQTLEMTDCTVRGNDGGQGGGIWSAGTTSLTDCVVEDNRAVLIDGGGLYLAGGTTTLAGNTQVRGNHVETNGFIGGGIGVVSAVLVIAESCRVTGNTAPAGGGGGIGNALGDVTLQGAVPSPIVVDNCHENCSGTVPGCASSPVSC
jgi:hypothetical protein